MLKHVYIYIIHKYRYLAKLERPHCDVTRMMLSKGNHPQLAFFEVGEWFKLPRLRIYRYYIYVDIYIYMYIQYLYIYTVYI